MNKPLFKCTKFPPCFGRRWQNKSQYLRSFAELFTGNFRRVFHNIYYCYIYSLLRGITGVKKGQNAIAKQLKLWTGG